MSWKQRRDIIKENSHDKDDREQHAMTQFNVDSLLKNKPAPSSTLQQRRRQRSPINDDGDNPSLLQDIQMLELEVKMNKLKLSDEQKEARRKNYQASMQAFMIPETGEDEEYESSEDDDLEETKDDELTDELAAR